MLEGTVENAEDAVDERVAADDVPPLRSLAEDIEALYQDGRTYAEAELAYQKTRVRLVAAHGKAGLGFGILALFLLHMALIGLTVGAILTLSPLVGPLSATAIVVGVLLVLVIGLALFARARFGRIGAAFGERTK